MNAKTPVAAALLLAATLSLSLAPPAGDPLVSTFSIVAHDPATGEDDVRTLSTVVRGGELVLFTVGEESIEGQTWQDGARGDDPKAGLLLSVWPDTVQQLVLGRLDPAEAAGAAEGGQGSRAGAFWKLFKTKDDEPPAS